MKELMQKALTVLGHYKDASISSGQRGEEAKPCENRQPEDWGMSPEDALRVGTVARYK